MNFLRNLIKFTSSVILFAFLYLGLLISSAQAAGGDTPYGPYGPYGPTPEPTGLEGEILFYFLGSLVLMLGLVFVLNSWVLKRKIELASA